MAVICTFRGSDGASKITFSLATVSENHVVSSNGSGLVILEFNILAKTTSGSSSFGASNINVVFNGNGVNKTIPMTVQGSRVTKTDSVVSTSNGLVQLPATTGTFAVTVSNSYGGSIGNVNGRGTYTQTHTYNVIGGALRSNATCTAAATYYYKCACGLQGSNYYSSGNALGHSNTAAGALRSYATCTAPATYWYNCSRCGTQSASYYSSGNALGHSNTAAGALRTNATCTAPATYWYKCSRCGTQSASYFNSGNALGHAYPTDFTYVNNNGVSKGARYQNCTRCKGRLITQFAVYSRAGTGVSAASGTNWYNSGATANIDATVKTGYTWSKWSDNVATKARSLTNIKKAYDLTASATANQYTIAYNGNGASGGSTASSTHTYDASKVLVTNGYTRPGYKFLGWATSPTGTVVYQDAQEVLNLATANGVTVNLYAVWELTANCRVKHDGVHKPGMVFVKQGDAYKHTLVHVKHNGTYKPTGL